MKRECSKVILIVSSIVFAVVIIFSMVMIAITKEISALEMLIGSVATVVTAGVTFYYNKAKLENKIKLMSKYKVDPDAESFREE